MSDRDVLSLLSRTATERRLVAAKRKADEARIRILADAGICFHGRIVFERGQVYCLDCPEAFENEGGWLDARAELGM